MQQHRAVPFEDFVRQFDDEPVGEDKITQGLDMKQVFHLHARLAVLAENGIGRGRGTRNTRQAMDKNFCLGWEFLGEVQYPLHVSKMRGFWMVWNACVREKAEEQLSARSNLLHQFATHGVIETTLVPNRNDVGPALTLLVR